MEELLKAFESIYRNDKRTHRFFGPVNDDYLPLYDRLVLGEPFKLIVEHNYTIDVPLLIGLNSNEGAFVDGEVIFKIITFSY